MQQPLKVDLHIHTSFSDGVYSPEKLLHIADTKNFDVIAFADHDNVDGYLHGKAIASNYKCKLIPGIEISCFHEGFDIHILAYNFDPTHKALLDVIEYNLQEREDRIARFIEKLAEYDVFLTLEEIKTEKTHILGRPHLANALVKAGYANTYAEAFNKYLVEESPTFTPKRALSPLKVIKAIKAAGGISVLAHPFRLNHEQYIYDLIRMGIEGLEAYYISHSKAQVSNYLEIAREHDLFVTGGSDFHWPTKNKNFGDYHYSKISKVFLPEISSI